MNYIKYILGILLLGSGSSLMADNLLHIKQKNGQEVSYLLSDNPRAAMVDSDHLLFECKGNSVVIPFDEISSFNLEVADEDAISHALASRPLFQLSGATMQASGLEAGTQLQLFDAAGRKVAQVRVSASGTASVGLQSLPQGTYIVKSTTSTYKILKK